MGLEEPQSRAAYDASARLGVANSEQARRRGLDRIPQTLGVFRHGHHVPFSDQDRTAYSSSTIPDFAEFILGRANGATRGLHPGYDHYQPTLRRRWLLVIADTPYR